MSDKPAELVNIATDLIISELKRRAQAKGMTPVQLLEAADANWREAEEIGNRLSNAGGRGEAPAETQGK